MSRRVNRPKGERAGVRSIAVGWHGQRYADARVPSSTRSMGMRVPLPMPPISEQISSRRSLRRQIEDLFLPFLGELMGVEVVIGSALADQITVGAGFGYLAGFDDQDPIGAADRAQPVGDDERDA